MEDSYAVLGQMYYYYHVSKNTTNRIKIQDEAYQRNDVITRHVIIRPIDEIPLITSSLATSSSNYDCVRGEAEEEFSVVVVVSCYSDLLQAFW